MIRLVAMFTLAAAFARAQPVESWNTVEAGAGKLRGADVILHTQFRWNVNRNQVTQGRIGPVIRFNVTQRVSMLGGYYFRNLAYRGEWGNSHRYFGGVQTPFHMGPFELAARTMIERHFAGPAPDQVQFRQMLRFSWRRRFHPSIAPETFYDQRGFLEQRWTAGFSWNLGERTRSELNYLYSFRPERAGGNRQAISFALRFDSPLHLF